MQRDEVLKEWAQYIQPPEELAFSRIRKFPGHVLDRLTTTLGIESSDRILNVGSGVGIMAAQLGSWLDNPENMVAIEPNEQLTSLPVPESLNPRPGIVEQNASGEDIPFEDNTFDVVLSHTVLNVLPEDFRRTVFEDMKRVVRPDGAIISMGWMVGAGYTPDYLEGDEEQRDHVEAFENLHQEAHEEINSGYCSTFESMPEFFRDQGLTKVETRGWFHPFRISDYHWSDQQRRDLIDFEKRADSARAETLRNLFEALDWWEEKHEGIIKGVKDYYKYRRRARLEGLDEDRESGWSAGGTLVVKGRPNDC